MRGRQLWPNPTRLTFDYLLGFVRRPLGEKNKMSSERREEIVLTQFVFSKEIFLAAKRDAQSWKRPKKKPQVCINSMWQTTVRQISSNDKKGGKIFFMGVTTPRGQWHRSHGGVHSSTEHSRKSSEKRTTEVLNTLHKCSQTLMVFSLSLVQAALAIWIKANLTLLHWSPTFKASVIWRLEVLFDFGQGCCICILSVKKWAWNGCSCSGYHNTLLERGKTTLLTYYYPLVQSPRYQERG